MKTVRDIKEGETIDLELKVVGVNEIGGDTALTRKVYFHDVNEEFVEMPFFEGSEKPDVDWEVGEWYHLENVKGDYHEYLPQIKDNWGNFVVSKMDRVPMSSQRHVSKNGCFAFDIETYTPESDPTTIDSQNMEENRIFCIGLGYQPDPNSGVEFDVLVSEGTSKRDELSLLISLCDWFEERNGDTAIFYDADYNISGVLDRSQKLQQEFRDSDVHGRLKEFVDSVHVKDMKTYVERVFDEGYRYILGEACEELDIELEDVKWDNYDHELEFKEWRRRYREEDEYVEVSSSVVLDKDIPFIGEKYLGLVEEDENSVQKEELGNILYRYSIENVRPLFKLAQRPKPI